MSISASQIVKVIPRVINAGATELETVGMYLTENALCPFPKTMTFESASAVGAYFGLDSVEFKQATKYFLGYNNSFKKPRKVNFGRYVSSDIAGTYVGIGTVGTISELQNITKGKIVFNIDGARKAAVGLNFSGVTTESDVAMLLTTALGTATVEYNSNLKEFIITSNTKGATSKVEFVEDGGGTETVVVLGRYKLTSSATGEGYTVDEDGLSKNGVLVGNWAYVSTNWSTLETLFTADTTGPVYQYKWEEQTLVKYGEPSAESQATAEVLGLLNGNAWAGSAQKTPIENMNAIIELNQNWVSFTTLKEVDTDTIIEFAKWVNGTECEYLYCPYTTKVIDINPLSENNLPKKLKDGNYEGVVVTYGTVDYATLVMSIGACIDWERVNGLVTYAFKQQSGLEATIDNNTDAENAKGLLVNFYGNYATRNDQFVWYYQGSMSGGQFGFVDTYIGQLWLRNVIQVSVMNGLSLMGRVPYTEEGYTYIRAWLQDPLGRALNNGTIAGGVAMSETQKATIMSETGDNGAPDEIFLKGYYLQITDPSASVRAERGTPVIGLWYTYGGSIHRVEIPVTAVL